MDTSLTSYYRDDDEPFNMPDSVIQNWPGYHEPSQRLNYLEEEKVDNTRIFNGVSLALCSSGPGVSSAKVADKPKAEDKSIHSPSEGVEQD